MANSKATGTFIAECRKDMAAMNVKPATTHPLATKEIDGMISMIQTLVDKGYAYFRMWQFWKTFVRNLELV